MSNAQICASTPRPAARTLSSIHANSTPASCGLLLWKSGQCLACFLAALRAAGWRGGRPHPAGSVVARPTNAPPASVPAELPNRATYRMSALVTSARGRKHVRAEGSRARMPGSRVVHRAEAIGGRMPPATAPRSSSSAWRGDCASTPRPAAHTIKPETPFRRRHPAGCSCGRPDTGRLFFAALRAAGIARRRRHPAAYRLCAMDHSGAGHPCPAPFKSGTLTPSRGCDWRTHPVGRPV